jgi:hypothetical protein
MDCNPIGSQLVIPYSFNEWIQTSEAVLDTLVEFRTGPGNMERSDGWNIDIHVIVNSKLYRYIYATITTYNDITSYPMALMTR